MLLLLLGIIVAAFAEVQVEIPNVDDVIYAINAGGSEYVSPTGINYDADRYYLSSDQSQVATTGNPIEGVDFPLYQSERFGKSVSYSLGLKDKGWHTLILKFAEVYWVVPGMKIFDVSVNGVVVHQNLDILRYVGVNSALDVAIPFFFTGQDRPAIRINNRKVPAVDSTLSVKFTAKQDNAKVCALVLVKGEVQGPPLVVQKKAGFLQLYGALIVLTAFTLGVIGFTLWVSRKSIKARLGLSKKHNRGEVVKKQLVTSGQATEASSSSKRGSRSKPSSSKQGK